MSEARNVLVQATAHIVCAFLSRNKAGIGELPGLIDKTYGALAGLKPTESARENPWPGAVSIRKSLASREFILSMIDGKPYRILTRHLSSHGLTPVEYRARYRLPPDYPMCAPAASERRRAMARARWGG